MMNSKKVLFVKNAVASTTATMFIASALASGCAGPIGFGGVSEGAAIDHEVFTIDEQTFRVYNLQIRDCNNNGIQDALEVSPSVTAHGRYTPQPAADFDFPIIQHTLTTAYMDNDELIDLIAVRGKSPGYSFAESYMVRILRQSRETGNSYSPHATVEIPNDIEIGHHAPTPEATKDSLHLASGDFDGDGALDLALTHVAALNPANTHSMLYGKVTILMNNGSGNFDITDSYDLIVEPMTRSTKPYGIVTGHLDDDPDLDIAVSHQDGIALLLNDGTGRFETPQTFWYDARSISGGTPSPMILADLDADNIHDIIAFDNILRKLMIIVNRGASLDTPIYFREDYPHSAVSFTASDLNRDSRVDIAIASRRIDGTIDAGNIEVFLNNGDATFSDPVAYPVALLAFPDDTEMEHRRFRPELNGHHLGIVDIDGDDDKDILSIVKYWAELDSRPGTYIAVDNLVELLNNGSGVFFMGSRHQFPPDPYSGAYEEMETSREVEYDRITTLVAGDLVYSDPARTTVSFPDIGFLTDGTILQYSYKSNVGLLRNDTHPPRNDSNLNGVPDDCEPWHVQLEHGTTRGTSPPEMEDRRPDPID